MEWTDCQIILHGNRLEVTILKPTCGSGLQYRNLTCLKINGMYFSVSLLLSLEHAVRVASMEGGTNNDTITILKVKAPAKR